MTRSGVKREWIEGSEAACFIAFGHLAGYWPSSFEIGQQKIYLTAEGKHIETTAVFYPLGLSRQ